MRLRKPCEHDRYDAHRAVPYVEADPLGNCPGGEFLPEDALVIEKVDGEWPEAVIEIVASAVDNSGDPTARRFALAVLGALAVEGAE